MANLYLIVSSIIFPVLAICWLCCISCCIYKSLVKRLSKAGRTTRVQVMVSDRRSSSANSSPTRPHTSSSILQARTNRNPTVPVPGTMPDIGEEYFNAYGPVVLVPKGLKSSLEAQGKSLNDSLGPVYYPKYPQSQRDVVSDTPTRKGVSPMTPLQPPWPHLPPISTKRNGNNKRLPTSIRSFLENQR